MRRSLGQTQEFALRLKPPRRRVPDRRRRTPGATDQAAGIGLAHAHEDAPERLSASLVQHSHKSRGSEYPAVVIPVVTQHYAMLAETSSTRA